LRLSLILVRNRTRHIFRLFQNLGQNIFFWHNEGWPKNKGPTTKGPYFVDKKIGPIFLGHPVFHCLPKIFHTFSTQFHFLENFSLPHFFFHYTQHYHVHNQFLLHTSWNFSFHNFFFITRNTIKYNYFLLHTSWNFSFHIFFFITRNTIKYNYFLLHTAAWNTIILYSILLHIYYIIISLLRSFFKLLLLPLRKIL